MTPILQFPSSGKADLSARICKRYSKEISALAGRCFEITMTTAHVGGYQSDCDNQVAFETYIAAGSGRDKQITKWFRDANQYLDELA